MRAAYFASDFHLGAPDLLQSKAREQAIVSWLEYAAQDASDIYLVGDVFDFWFEYKRVIPKGYSRLFGTIARLSDQGIQFHFFYGNHDMWVKSYFKEEFNMKIHAEPITLNLFGKKMLVGHGDGLGPGDRGYKLIKPILRSPFCQWAFARLHPNFGIGLASFFSSKSRKSQDNEYIFKGAENEWLYQYSKEVQLKNPYDYYIFGHRHLPLSMPLDNAVYYNLGEWLTFNTFIKMESGSPSFLRWNGKHPEPFEPQPHGAI